MYNENIWVKSDQTKEIFAFGEDYKEFISNCKTERLCTKEAVKELEAKGFKEISSVKTLKAGDKVYKVNKGKNVCAFIVGKKDVREGLRILGAHIDSPRMDLKQHPLYEKKGFALLDTHYYGGIKKYQWVTIPLALYGVVVKKDGSVVDINIGDGKDDPVLGVTDLLIHLAADQMTKKANVVIEGEDLDLTAGSIPCDDKKDAVKKNILKLIKDKYNIEEEDFLSAEIEVVPAGPARDYGLDRSMIAGYGHDDRSCAYTSLRAILDIKNPEYTSCTILVDKEEIGSVGATGAQSYFFENAILELLDKTGDASLLALRKTLENSKMLSSDVSAGVDPLYTSAYDENNACFLGKGIVFNKYTGARGKSGSNDAMPEYFAWVRNIMDNDGIFFQTAELGKVDQGGGGTIAYILGNTNMNVVDAGIAVLNMHAPMEIVSKADVYEAYKAYKTFLTK
ncbi:MAG: aminopeptidase [Acholeplasmatales bacterium]|nr:aminopeptidase [Acholeplasmatales bacterium]